MLVQDTPKLIAIQDIIKHLPYSYQVVPAHSYILMHVLELFNICRGESVKQLIVHGRMITHTAP